MGDERYYTFSQFFGVLALTLILATTLIYMVSDYIGRPKGRRFTLTGVLYLEVFFLALFKTVEYVIVQTAIGAFLRQAIAVFFLLAFIGLMFHFICYFSEVKLSKKRYKALVYGYTLTGLIMFISNRLWVVKHYDFRDTAYTSVYGFAISLSMVVWLYIVVMDLISGDNVERLYKRRVRGTIIVVMQIVPLAIYGYGIIKEVMWLDRMEVALIGTMLATVKIFETGGTEMGISAGAFNRIGDMTKDIVFVIDAEGYLVYRNKSAENSPCFIDGTSQPIDHMKALFKSDAVVKTDPSGSIYAMLSTENDQRYFGYKQRPLTDEGMVIGTMMTFTDMTEIMAMLEQLETQKKASEKANNQLKHYAEIVYHLEKEKRIKDLLEEVLANRETEMDCLRNKIETLKELPEGFEQLIAEVIEYNREILEGVRKTVNTYRDY